jgi:hypothetical protein
MAINFPDSPTTGETFQQADRAWQWDGEKWKSTGTTSSATVGATVVFEGSTADAFETTLAATDPTADRTITLPNASGTVAFTSDIPTVAGVYAPLASPEFTGNVTMQSLDMGDIVAGDVIYGSGADTLARLAKGSNDQVLTLASGVPSWADAGGGGGTSIADADADTKIQVEESADEDKIRFDTGGTERAVLDSSGLEIKTGNLKVPTGNGIDFSATGDTAVTGAAMSSELLDDYEEGTWTASFLTGGGSIAPNTAYDTMNYTKIGRLVNVSGNVDGFTVSSPTGALEMRGLPYAVADTAERSDRAAFTVLARGLVSAESDIFGYFIAGSGLVINYGNGGTSGGGAHMATIIDAGSYIHINATYTAAT